eukprot:765653-Pyramimonas_sp.AAC.1
MDGNTIEIFCVYDPHNLKPLPERTAFYDSLDKEYRTCRANFGKNLLGDFSSRVGQARAGDEHVV